MKNKKKFKQKKFGMAMESLSSLVLSNTCMEYFVENDFNLNKNILFGGYIYCLYDLDDLKNF